MSPTNIHVQRILLGHRAQLAFDVVERELRHFEQHQALGTQADDLPAQFRADRAARARHHHHAVANARVEQPGLGRHRIASQKIAHVDLADVAHIRISGHELLEFRHGLHMHAQGLERAQDLQSAPAGQ